MTPEPRANPASNPGLGAGKRDSLGQLVREVWLDWARRQPNPKASWLLPYAQLAEADKEVDRMIGEALFLAGKTSGLESFGERLHLAEGTANTLQNCADTIRSRGFGSDLGSIDDRVIAMAQALDAARAENLTFRSLLEGYVGPFEECDPEGSKDRAASGRDALEQGSEFYLGKTVVDAVLLQAMTQVGVILVERPRGMRVEVSHLLAKACQLIKGRDTTGQVWALGELQVHLAELGRRFYSGDLAVVDEFLQLYGLDEHRPAPQMKEAESGEPVAPAK